MDDFSLVGSSQAGDRAAFDRLIDRHYRDVYRFARHYAGSHHDADEVCQETFLRAFVNIGKLRDGRSFKGWIFTIASNIMRKQARKSARETTLGAENREAFEAKAVCDRSAEPFEALCVKEKAIIIHEQLQEMPEKMRLATILILMHGFSQKDAAAIVGRSEASVSRDLDMARKWFRARLQNLA